MTNVSHRRLSKKEWSKIYVAFIDCMNPLSRNAWRSPLNDLLSEAEKIMLAKRFAIILLTIEDFSGYRISNILDVSISTVLRIQRLWDKGKYQYIEKYLKDKKNRENFLGILQNVLLLGGLVPPMVGEKRSDWLRRIDRRKR